MSVSPERIEEALAIIDAAPPYSHVPSSKMTLLEAADVVAAALREEREKRDAAAALREAQAELKGRVLVGEVEWDALERRLSTLQAENERMREWIVELRKIADESAGVIAADWLIRRIDDLAVSVLNLRVFQQLAEGTL